MPEGQDQNRFADIRVGLVVPGYGYSNFLPEMASSILAQESDVPFIAVLVDDCDPDPGMVELCQTYATAHPDVFHYIRPAQNGGLSATRNAGIDYLLALCPNLDILMFPDADDRLLPGFVRKSHAAFCEKKHEAEARGETLGWVFESPNIFGQNGFMHRLTVHSTLWNLVGATQMPSSALSAEMYRAGLRYDETMKWGGEDWEFSIRALNAGFVGKYAPDLGFLWRRRPGSMSSASLQTKAREHNRTLIRMRNPEMFKRDAIWRRWEGENTHFCLLTEHGWHGAATPDALKALLTQAEPQTGERQAPGDFSDLARSLNNSITHVTDPCPQSFCVAAQPEPGGAALADGPLTQMIQWGEFLNAMGFAVTHCMAEAGSDRLVPEVSPRAPDGAREVLHVLTRPQLLHRLRGGRIAPDRHLCVTWPRPEPATQRGAEIGLVREDMRARTAPRPAIAERLSAALEALNASGYAFAQPQRFGTQVWKPQNLDWRRLPGFLLGSPNQRLQDTGLADQSILLCHVRYARDLCARLADWGVSGLDVMVECPMDDPFHVAQLDAIAASPVIGTLHVLEKRTTHGISLEALSTNILGLYGSVLHWRSTDYTGYLSPLKKLGVRNTLMVTRADMQARGVNFSSMFKCYDSYTWIDESTGADRPDDTAHAQFASRGIPSQRQDVYLPGAGDKTTMTHQRMPKQNAV